VYPKYVKQYELIMLKKFEDNLEDWEIKTMWATWLGLEIPWLKSYEGQKIGDSQRTIDAHGANLMACTGLTGDYWRVTIR
jgi:hypothetical protein